MSKENVSNFASTTLATSIAGTNTTPTFTVQTGAGANFPTVDAALNPRWLIIGVDTELMICSQRSGDTFTIASRGVEGTAMAVHAIGAPVTLGFTAGMINRIWTNVPETYNPDVPPYIYTGVAPSTWTDEFEGISGLWSYYPSASNYDISSSHFSCFTFNRADSDNTTYWFYKPFQPGTGSWQATAKLSHSAHYGLANNCVIDLCLLISDQANPTGATDAGNNVHISSVYNNANYISMNTASGPRNSNIRTINTAHATSGVGTLLNQVIDQGELYLRIAYNGSGLFAFFIGDGYTFRDIGGVYKTLNLANGSIGFRFQVTNGSGISSRETAIIDWLRVDTGIPYFSS